MLKQLNVIPLGGLCNRMRTIASALRICHLTGAICCVHWEWGDFYALFEKPTVLNFSVISERTPLLGFKHIIHLRPQEGGSRDNWKIPTKNGEYIAVATRHSFGIEEDGKKIFDKDITPWLPIPAKQLLGTIVEQTKVFPTRIVGMHIRRTDHPIARKYTPDDLCIYEGSKIIDYGYKIFLATDNIQTEKVMLERFRENILTYKKIPEMSQRWPKRVFSLLETQQDLIDLHLLAKCNYVLGSFGSSYSSLAMHCNGDSRCKFMKI
jgi:hypothetical protein